MSSMGDLRSFVNIYRLISNYSPIGFTIEDGGGTWRCGSPQLLVKDQ